MAATSKGSLAPDSCLPLANQLTNTPLANQLTNTRHAHTTLPTLANTGAFFEAGARGRWSGASSPSSPAESPGPPPLSPLMSVSVPRNRRGSIFSFEEEDQPSAHEVPIGMTSPVAAALAAGKALSTLNGHSRY